MSSQHFPFRRSEEDHEHPSLREQFTLAAHDLADHDQFGHADEGHNHDDSYPLEVRDRRERTTAANLDGTETTINELSLEIPSPWTTWDVVWGWTFQWDSNTASSNRRLELRVRHGSLTGPEIAPQVSTTVTTTPAVGMFTHTGAAEGLSGTGTQKIRLTGQLGANDAYTTDQVVGWARAVKVS